jgi:N utilization substance protein B
MSEKIDLKARHNARKHAVQAIYQWQLTQLDIRAIEQQFITEFLGTRVEQAYFQELLYGIPREIQQIDAAFSPYLSSRTQGEVDPVELAVLRLASYELLFRPDVPYQVVINEALELTKTFGTNEGFRFINGVIDKVAQTVRTLEVTSRKQNS